MSAECTCEQCRASGSEGSDKCHPPFVHRVQTDRSRYLYDVPSSRFIECDAVAWDIVSDLGVMPDDQIAAKWAVPHGAAEVTRSVSEIRGLQEQGLLTQGRPPRAVMPISLKSYTEKLATAREQLILNLTENCNFRCKYCIFGEAYELRREHSTKVMTWEVAQKAVDEHLRCCIKAEAKKKAAITFYGGEPLLSFDLLKKVVVYAEEKADFPLFFSLTINGSLLDEQIGDFLVEHGIAIMVSLDGPREMHDACRVTAGGKPTWDLVVSKVRAFSDRHPDYRDSGLFRFSAVMPGGVDTQKLDEFFSTWDLAAAGEVGININAVTTDGSAGACSLHPELFAPLDLSRIFASYKANLISGAINANPHAQTFKFQRAVCESSFVMFHKRQQRVLGPEGMTINVSSGATCLPGVRRVFVTCDGMYMPCERVPQFSEEYVIGSVETGVISEKGYALLSKWFENRENACNHCMGMTHCASECLASLHEKGVINDRSRNRACTTWRRWFHELLTIYCSILEQNPHAFDYMDGIDVT